MAPPARSNPPLSVVVELSAVILAVHDAGPQVLVVERDGRPALPSGPFDPTTDRTLDRSMRRWASDLTGIPVGFVEQLYTFGDIDRDADASERGERRLSVAYLAFVRDGAGLGAGPARWVDVYDLLPWEDRRTGTPLADDILPRLDTWVAAAAPGAERAARQERVDMCWSTNGARWDPVRSLERYELLFETRLVAEAGRGRRATGLGEPAALDHRRILASALGRVRGKLTYRPVVFELLPPTFTLSQLQRVVEALAGVGLHKQNFRRLVEGAGLVEGTGERTEGASGRPAELFRFRREVIRERPAPGLHLPGRR